MIALGAGDAAQNALSLVPNNLVLDRCYIHGDAALNVVRGVALNSAQTIIRECYIADFHIRSDVPTPRPDAQAIAGWNGPGWFWIMNNYLEGGDENLLFGGADPAITNLVPSDIWFCGNHCYKPLSWKTNPSLPHWSVKNLFELKNAQRVLMEGNVFEQVWIGADQHAHAIGLTVRNQDGAAPWSVLQDVTVRNNVVRHANNGIILTGYDDNNPSQKTQKIILENNLFLDLDPASWGGTSGPAGQWLTILGGGSNYTINHNTALQRRAILYAIGDPATGALGKTTSAFIFTNNVSPHNGPSDGISGDSTATGLGTLTYYFPGNSFLSNVLPGADAAVYPAMNFYPATLAAVGFIDLSGGNYRLDPTSPYHNQGTDGRDPGCDVDALDNATRGVIKYHSI